MIGGEINDSLMGLLQQGLPSRDTIGAQVSTTAPQHRSSTLGKLAEALAKAQGQIKPAIRESANPFFKSTYADLASVWDACRIPLSSNSLSVAQFIRRTRDGVEVETMLMHASGEWLSSVLAVPVAKADAQGVGSAATYAKRYALAAMVGVAPGEDDDAESIARHPAPQEPVTQPRRQEREMNSTVPVEQTAPQDVPDIIPSCVIHRVSIKDGVNPTTKTPYKHFTVATSGGEFTTFDTKHGEFAQARVGKTVRISSETKGRFKNIVEIRE